MEAKKSAAKEQKEALFAQAKHGALRIDAAQQAESDAFAADYFAFLNASKTEREAVITASALLE